LKIRGKFKDSREFKNIFYNKKMFLKEETVDFSDQENQSSREPIDFTVVFSLYYPLFTLLAASLVFLKATIFLLYPMLQLPSLLKFLYPLPYPIIQFSTNFVIQRNLEKIIYPLLFLIFLSAAYYWSKISGILTRRLIPKDLLKHI
jgi:hypothetical protein